MSLNTMRDSFFATYLKCQQLTKSDKRDVHTIKIKHAITKLKHRALVSKV